MLNKLERKFGKYAIPNLTMTILIIYAVGYVFYYMARYMNATAIYGYILLDPYAILHGQVWRLFTWLLAPPQMDILSFLITSFFFYYPIGRQLEAVMGDFRYNFYLLGGFFFTIIGAFLNYAFYAIAAPGQAQMISMTSSLYFTPYYVTMSIFFAFAVTFPEDRVLLFFMVPLKIKYLGIVYGVFLAYEALQGSTVQRIVIICSLFNFFVYWLLTFRDKGGAQRIKRMREQALYEAALRAQQEKRRREAMNGQGGMGGPGMSGRNAAGPAGTAGYAGGAYTAKPQKMTPRHKCAVCGRTEADDASLEFRYCSKCHGTYEYCQDHLFTHTHVQ